MTILLLNERPFVDRQDLAVEPVEQTAAQRDDRFPAIFDFEEDIGRDAVLPNIIKKTVPEDQVE